MVIYETPHHPKSSFSIDLALSDFCQFDEYKKISNIVLIYISLITREIEYFFNRFLTLSITFCELALYTFGMCLGESLSFPYWFVRILPMLRILNCGQLYVLILLSLSQGLHFNFVYGLFGLVLLSYASIYFSEKLVETQSVCRKLCTA